MQAVVDTNGNGDLENTTTTHAHSPTTTRKTLSSTEPDQTTITNDDSMMEIDSSPKTTTDEQLLDPEAKALIAAIKNDTEEQQQQQQRSNDSSSSSSETENVEKPSNIRQHATSSISPGGSAFTSSGVSSSATAKWFPSKLHQLLTLFDRSDYKDDCKWNFSTSGPGLQVTLFWQHKNCMEEPAIAFNCFTQVADCKENLTEFIAKPKQQQASPPVFKGNPSTADNSMLLQTSATTSTKSKSSPYSKLKNNPSLNKIRELPSTAENSNSSERATTIKNILSQYNKKSPDGGGVDSHKTLPPPSPNSSEENSKTREDNLARLINGFQESLEQGFNPPSKKMRVDGGDQGETHTAHDGRVTPIGLDVSGGEASMALASKALLAQIEKQNQKGHRSNNSFPNVLSTVQNSKSSSNNIKDALEQLLSKRSNQNDIKTEPIHHHPATTISAANAANVVSDMLNSKPLNTTTAPTNTLTITHGLPQNFDSMLNSSSLSSMLSNVTGNTVKSTPTSTTTGLPALNLSSILSGNGGGAGANAGNNLLSGSTNLLSNLNGMLAAATGSSAGGLNLPGLTSGMKFDTNNSGPSHRNSSPMGGASGKSPASKGGADGEGKESAQQRRVPVRFTADQKRLLYQLFEVNRYPKKPEREEIATKIGVPEYAVHNFFSNTRKAIYRAAAATPGGQASLAELPTSLAGITPGSHIPGVVSGDGSLTDSLAALTSGLNETNEHDTSNNN